MATRSWRRPELEISKQLTWRSRSCRRALATTDGSCGSLLRGSSVRFGSAEVQADSVSMCPPQDGSHDSDDTSIPESITYPRGAPPLANIFVSPLLPPSLPPSLPHSLTPHRPLRRVRRAAGAHERRAGTGGGRRAGGRRRGNKWRLGEVLGLPGAVYRRLGASGRGGRPLTRGQQLAGPPPQNQVHLDPLHNSLPRGREFGGSARVLVVTEQLPGVVRRRHLLPAVPGEFGAGASRKSGA